MPGVTTICRPEKPREHLHGHPGSRRIGVERIVDDGDAVARGQKLQPMLHRLHLGDPPDQLFFRKAQLQGHGHAAQNILNVVFSQ